MRRIAISVAATSMSVMLAGCGVLNAAGSSDDASPSKGDDVTVGLLLPEKANTRYEQFDYPIFKTKVESLTNKKGTVEYANAEADADKQASQMQQMIDDPVDVIVLDAVDAHAIADSVQKAKDAGIPVIAYDRLAEGPIDAYISFDNSLVGEVQGRSLLESLGGEAGITDKIVMMNGSPTDPNAKQFKAGALSVLEGRVEIAKAYDTPQWRTEVAHMNMSGAISALGADNIDGVYAANDGLAAGSIAALKANKVDPLPPVTGQDAELQAVRRIVAGEQYMTVYKPFEPEASAGAALAVAAARGESLDRVADDTVRTSTGSTVPAVLLTPVSVTVGAIGDTVVKDGVYTVRQICTPQLVAACARAGLT